MHIFTKSHKFPTLFNRQDSSPFGQLPDSINHLDHGEPSNPHLPTGKLRPEQCLWICLYIGAKPSNAVAVLLALVRSGAGAWQAFYKRSQRAYTM